MNVLLNSRQKQIINKLRLNDAGENVAAFDDLEREQMSEEDVQALCSIINAEFMMEGILPNFEPNTYGIELENLLDVINKQRVRSRC